MIQARLWGIVFLSMFAYFGIGCASAKEGARPIVSPAVTETIASEQAVVSATPTLLVTAIPLAATETAVLHPTEPATNTPIPPTIPPTATPVVDSGWETLQPGIDKRLLNLYTESGVLWESVYILRLDPTLFRFDIGYAPGEPKLLATWQEETDALIVVNGGFFTPEQTATALVLTDGVPHGSSYIGFGGMVGMTADQFKVLDLARTPYSGTEGFTAGMQSFPMLIRPGGEIGFPAEKETGRRARRTVLGQDRNGRVLILITPRGGFTLHQLSLYLAESDLDLDVALNLDGGPSSGVLLMREGSAEGHAAYTAVPLVLLVHQK